MDRYAWEASAASVPGLRRAPHTREFAVRARRGVDRGRRGSGYAVPLLGRAQRDAAAIGMGQHRDRQRRRYRHDGVNFGIALDFEDCVGGI